MSSAVLDPSRRYRHEVMLISTGSASQSMESSLLVLVQVRILGDWGKPPPIILTRHV